MKLRYSKVKEILKEIFYTLTFLNLALVCGSKYAGQHKKVPLWIYVRLHIFYFAPWRKDWWKYRRIVKETHALERKLGLRD